MGLNEETNNGIGATMLVGPTGYPQYPMNGGNGFGGDWAWIILLLLLGWGNNGFGNGARGGMGGGYGADCGVLYPWMNQANLTSNGFQNQLLNDNITEIRTGVTGLASQMSNGFANAETAATARQMANMNQAFAAQTAMNQGFNQLGSRFDNCCCEQRLGTADLKYTIATENCADRAAISDGIRDVITNQTANTQRILDQLCQDKIDAKNEKIADLERQLTMANLATSQVAQTAQIQRGQVAEVDALYNRLRDCPVPTMPVYGMQPIFTCQQNQGCGCNCGCGVA